MPEDFLCQEKYIKNLAGIIAASSGFVLSKTDCAKFLMSKLECDLLELQNKYDELQIVGEKAGKRKLSSDIKKINIQMVRLKKYIIITGTSIQSAQGAA